MAVLAMVLSGGVLMFCAVVFAQRLTRGGEPHRKHHRFAHNESSWSSGGLDGDSASDCGGADGGGGCDGGGAD